MGIYSTVVSQLRLEGVETVTGHIVYLGRLSGVVGLVSYVVHRHKSLLFRL